MSVDFDEAHYIRGVTESMQANTNLRPDPRKKVFQQATCAAILAASFAAPLRADSQPTVQAATTAASLLAGSCLALKAAAINSLQKYCSTSWRQAGISRADWDDCTQDVIVELLSRLPQSQAAKAITDPECPERRELVRSIWCVTQRWRRARTKQCVSLDVLGETEIAGRPTPSNDSWDALQPAIETLNPTQQRILEQLRQGASVAEIADDLNVPTARVSDQKYKAVKKLQKAVAFPATDASGNPVAAV